MVLVALVFPMTSLLLWWLQTGEKYAVEYGGINNNNNKTNYWREKVFGRNSVISNE